MNQITGRETLTDLDRRGMLRGVGLGAGLGGALALLGGSGVARAAAAGPFPAHPTWRLVFVNHVTTNPFFVPTQYGIRDACDLLGCTSQWTGSANADVGEMVNAMNAAIAAKADAIAVPIVDPRAFNDPTAKALEAGIPVFSYNADAPPGGGNKRLAYIGQDLYQSGYSMGERIVSMVDAGMVAIFIATPGQLNIQPRLDGAIAAIKKSGKQIDVQSIASGPTVNEELSRIRSFYLGHQDLKGMFAVDAGSTQGVGEVMQQFNLPAKGVHAGGYDLLPKDRIGHCHCKDVKRLPGGKYEWAPVGGGVVDWVGQFKALQRDGFHYAVSLETHWRGAGTPEASTRISMQGLKDSLKKAGIEC